MPRDETTKIYYVLPNTLTTIYHAHLLQPAGRSSQPSHILNATADGRERRCTDLLIKMDTQTYFKSRRLLSLQQTRCLALRAAAHCAAHIAPMQLSQDVLHSPSTSHCSPLRRAFSARSRMSSAINSSREGKSASEEAEQEDVGGVEMGSRRAREEVDVELEVSETAWMA